MALDTPSTNRLSTIRKDKRNKGLSSVISTVIITAALLIIFVVASFVATNILALQMADSEFQQAQSNMLLLDDVIQDVSLRQGAGSYVQFNQITGGIGISTDEQNKLVITMPGYTFTSLPLSTLVYNAGTSTPGAATILKGSNTTSVSVDQPMGFLRIETGNGVKIKLDYSRVRVNPMGLQQIGGTNYNFTGITLIHLTPGTFGGSGTVNVKTQNTQIQTRYFAYTNAAQNTTIQAYLTSNPTQTTNLFSIAKGDNASILLTVVEIKVSIG